jgi:hypothetical protein
MLFTLVWGRVQRLPVANTVSRQHLTPTGTGTYSTHGKRGTKPTFVYPQVCTGTLSTQSQKNAVYSGMG